jgi:hypothetical protein
LPSWISFLSADYSKNYILDKNKKVLLVVIKTKSTYSKTRYYKGGVMIKDNKIEKQSFDNKEFMILIFLTLIIFVIHIMHVYDIDMMFILDDEYGYWGNAAYLSGLNWSDTVSQIPYYSFGYSILLVPFFWIFDNTIHMYKAAIILNGILLSASFLFCYNVARKLMNKVNKYIVMSISFLISMYPTYIIYSHIAWSECLLMFVFWFITWCFTDLNIKTNVYKFIIIGFLSSYIYFIHQRAIGILIASIAVIMIMRFTNKISIKQFISAILPIIFIIVIGFYIKDDIQSKLWLNGAELSINDYSGQISKINQIFSGNGFLKVLKSFIGKFFYLGVASFLFFYIGVYELIANIWKVFTVSVRNKNYNELNSDDRFYLYIFLLVSATLTTIISTVFFINPIGIDEIVYGRYNEIILGPLILLGFVNFMKNEKNTNNLSLIILIGFTILTVITDIILKKSGLNIINTNTAHTCGLIFMNTKYGIYLPVVVCIVLFRLFWISFTKNNKMIIVTVIVITFLFFTIGKLNAESLAIQSKERMKMTRITSIIQSSEELPLYFLFIDTENPSIVKWNNRTIRDRSVADCYQFILKDQNIKPVNVDELRNIKEDKYVITTNNIDISDMLEDYQICGTDEGSILLKSK